MSDETPADNVIPFPGITHHDVDAADMLRSIAKDEPGHAFVICWPADGKMPSYHSSTGDFPVVLMRMQEFIHKWYNGEFKPPGAEPA